MLDRCAGGSILEPPVQLAKVEVDLDAAAELRARIRDDLLPFQRDVVDDKEHRIIGMVAGYGSGKSRTMCAW